MGKREAEFLKMAKNDLKIANKAKTDIDGEITKWVELYDGEKLGNERNGFSKFVSREVAKQTLKMKPNITEPFVSKSKPFTIRDDQFKKVERYLNKVYASTLDVQTRTEEMVLNLLKEGTLWVRSVWDTKESSTVIKTTIDAGEVPNYIEAGFKISEEDGEVVATKITTKMIRNRPDIEVIPNEEALPDPTVSRDDDMSFFIQRKKTTLDTLKRAGKISKEQYNRIKRDKDSKTNSENHETSNTSSGYEDTKGTKTDPKVYSVEYWGYFDIYNAGVDTPVVAMWIEGSDEVISLEESPMGDGTIPFYSEQFVKQRRGLWGKPLAFKLEDLQKAKSGIMRGIFDNMTEANNGQRFIMKGTLDNSEFEKMVNGYKNIFVNKPSGIEWKKFESLPPSILNIFQVLSQESNEISSVGGMALQDTATSKDTPSQLTQQQIEELEIVRKIDSIYRKIAKDWISLAAKFLENEQIEKLFEANEEIDYTIFERVDRDDLEISVLTSAAKKVKLFNMNMLMQQAATIAEQGNAKIIPSIIADMFESFDREDEADEIRANTKMQEQAKAQGQRSQAEEMTSMKEQLEIYEMQKESERKDIKLQLQAKEIEADAIYKQAKAKHAGMMADNTEMDTTLKPVATQMEMEKLAEGEKRQNEKF